jgi:putative heme-binding domain-containing protein
MGGALAFRPEQLAGQAFPGAASNKLMEELLARGMIDEPLARFEPAVCLADTNAGPTVEAEARTFLHINCSHCHRQNAGGAVTMMLNAELPVEKMKALDVAPTQGGLGLANPRLIDPGNPWNSVICVRLAKSGAGHMPLIGQSGVDPAGLRVLENWIASLKPGNHDLGVLDTEAAVRGKLSSVEGAMQVRRAVDDGILNSSLLQTALEVAWKSPEPTIRDLFDRFKPDDQRERTIGPAPDESKLLALSGDSRRGAAVLSLQGKLAACYACHLINGTGRDFGPDLSKVGARLKREQLLESLLHPSKVIAPGYVPVSIECSDGASQAGFVLKEDGQQITLKTPAGQSVVIPRASIKAQSRLPASLMPEGQLQSLTAQEAADVITFLQSLQ